MKKETIIKFIAVWPDITKNDGYDCEGYSSKSQANKNAPATSKIFPVELPMQELPK